MRIDDKLWWDAIRTTQLLDGTGLLTDEAKDLMKRFEVTNLDDLLNIIEGSGRGYWYRSDVNRSDVNTTGHTVFAETYTNDPDAQVDYRPRGYNNEDSYNDYK